MIVLQQYTYLVNFVLIKCKGKKKAKIYGLIKI